MREIFVISKSRRKKKGQICDWCIKIDRKKFIDKYKKVIEIYIYFF